MAHKKKTFSVLKKESHHFLVTQARTIFLLMSFFPFFPINFTVIVLDNNYILRWAEITFLGIPPT